MTGASCPFNGRPILTRGLGVTSVEVTLKVALAIQRSKDEMTHPEKFTPAPTANGYPTRSMKQPELNRRIKISLRIRSASAAHHVKELPARINI